MPAQPSHCNSLRDLLSAHKVVKVKFIADDAGDAEAGTLASGSGGAFLQQKGSTMMFARGEGGGRAENKDRGP